jgi:NDP-sugar pyrophosphorylase family protein
MSLQILLVEHDEVGGLYPFAATHCSWELRVGALTIHERWMRSLPTATITVSTHRQELLDSFVERHGVEPFATQPTLFFSGHVLLSPSVMRRIVEHCANARAPIAFYCNGVPVGAYLLDPPATVEEASAMLETLDPTKISIVEVVGHQLTRQWHALDLIDQAIAWDAELLGIGIDDDASVHPTAIIDTSNGPVIIMEGAEVGPYSVLKGPVAVCRSAIIKPHSVISSCVIGPWSKVSGEITSSVIHGYSNKQHSGFLGHSYIGEWVNLGADTTTSNLKSTYGTIRVKMPWLEEETDRIFLGALIGDHSKSAIGTMFPTGCICGVSSNIVISGSSPREIPSFMWLTSDSTDVFEIDKAIRIARTVMLRRNVELGPKTEHLLRTIHARLHG